MRKETLSYKPFGSAAILIEWPSEMSNTILEEVLRFYGKLQGAAPNFIHEVVQSVNSLTVMYDPDRIEYEPLIKYLKKIEREAIVATNDQTYYLWKIPVCYELVYGIDLVELSNAKQLTIDEIVALHSSATYRVFSIGFLPGFLYLGGLDNQLFTERRSTPRLGVFKGAVGIGGSQTGVYPSSSPGGWQIIGNSPISFFDKITHPPCFAKPGDYIKFHAVTKKKHEQLKDKIANGEFTLEKEVKSD